MAERFDPAKMERLLVPERKVYNDPDRVLAPLNLERCSGLADIGCGPGWFTIEAARRMPGGSTVYAVDVEQAMLDRLSERSVAAGLTNIQPVLAEAPDEFPVPSASCDAILLANVYHECDPYSNVIHELRRILQPGGTLLLVDWLPEPTPKGPPVAERVDPGDVIEEFTAGGFVFSERHDVGPYHYGLRFRRPADA